MFNRQTIVQIAVTAVLCAGSAIAQASQTGDSAHGVERDAHLMQHHMSMCTDHYARHVGEMAYLETKLALSDSQKPLFAAWKDAMLSNAKTRSENCVRRTKNGKPPMSLMDREARLHEMLEAWLAALDAQHPTLAALYQSLTPEQKQVFDMPRGGNGMHSPDGHDWHGHGPQQDGDGQGG